ncbi:hypothetical protein [Magnetospirillum molischianum]|uniref:Putative Phage-related protein-like n=1 Tax=Magnetospirillum molischianum DSM 120 TaxID=1150626 RepID=H8FY60_MAGML|nr:hypothetical protein [Magnetospirillum molischianum]CCG43298.1 putative Phage-related protein-like [Magnetospirillum molischianum DSM 120]
MARHLSVGTVIEKNRIASNVAFVILIEVEVKDSFGNLVEILRMARNNEPIIFQDNEYVAANFELSLKEQAGSIPEIQVVAQDHTLAIQQRMQEYGGGVGFGIRMIVVNTGNLSQPPEIVETFKVIRASARGYVVTFGLGAENPLSMRFPRRRQMRDRCSWRFGSAECGYVGDLRSCDLSLQGPNGCAAHGNTRRFGGFPGLSVGKR